ncbi:MAG: competence protein ComEA, partial [Deltaproteobacteria bacterium]
MKGMKKVLIYGLLVLAMSVVCQPAFSAEKININTASIEQLVELKGVGEKTAQHIVEY